jgi:hypothetical protein
MVRPLRRQVAMLFLLAAASVLARPGPLLAQQGKTRPAPAETKEPVLEPMIRQMQVRVKEPNAALGRIEVRLDAGQEVFILEDLLPADEDQRDRDDQEEEQASPAPDLIVSDEVFARWVFGMGEARDARRRLEEVLGTRVDEVEGTYQISPAQKRKLELAGRGDIKRLFDHIQEKRKELDRLEANETKTRRFVIGELLPLRARIRQGPFGEGSIFSKTLNKMLNERQLARRAAR